MSKVNIINHPLVQHKLSLMRQKDTSCAKFRGLLREIAHLLAYEVTRELPLRTETIETPLQTCQGHFLDGRDIALISILRAGNGLLEGIHELIPSARVGHIGLYREPETLTPVEYYYKMPPRMNERRAIILDPMLATGNSAIAAAHRVKDLGPLQTSFVCLLAAPEGIKAFHEEHPEVEIYTAAVDEGLNEKGYILPGVGDAGDRIYGTQ